MWRDIFSLSIRNPDFLWIFVLAFSVLSLKAATKYITKLSVFLIEPRDPRAVKAAHFDCLRLGLDLAFIGLVAALGILRIAFKTLEQSKVASLGTTQAIVIVVQFLMLTIATFFTALYHSPERTFSRGIWVPTSIGFLSVYASAMLFNFLVVR